MIISFLQFCLAIYLLSTALASILGAERVRHILLWLLIACPPAMRGWEHYKNASSFPRLSHPLEPSDPDAWLYLVQTRQWIEGLAGPAGGLPKAGGWAKAFFDHAVQNTNAPFGGITTPWTRPMEIIILAAYALTPPGLSVDERLLLAASWLPSLLLLGAIALLASALRRQCGRLQAAAFAGMLMLANNDTAVWLGPGNVDHHGLLCMLWCGVLALLVRDSLGAAGALVLGVILGLMIWISPEALALTGTVYALMGVEALLSPKRSAAAALTLARAATAAAVVAVFGLFMEMPPARALSEPHYDTLSVVQVTLLLLAAAGAGVLAYAYRRPLSIGKRFMAAALSGAGILFGMLTLYPKFFLGPLVDVDSFVVTDFLPRIGELMPLVRTGAEHLVRALMEPVLAVILCLLALARRYVRPERRRRLVILLALLVFTTVLTFWEYRWAYYLYPVAVVLVGMTIGGLSVTYWSAAARTLRGAKHLWLVLPAPVFAAVFFFHADVERYLPSFVFAVVGIILTRLVLVPLAPDPETGSGGFPTLFPRQARPYTVLWLAFLVANIILLGLPAEAPSTAPAGIVSPLPAEGESAPSACAFELLYVLQSRQLQPLLGTDPVTLFVPEDAGGAALFFTPYHIIASNFHREGEGLRAMHDISTASSAGEARSLLRRRNVRALLYCPGAYGAGSWLRTAADTQKTPSWLEPAGELRLSDGPNGGAPSAEDRPLLFRVRE